MLIMLLIALPAACVRFFVLRRPIRAWIAAVCLLPAWLALMWLWWLAAMGPNPWPVSGGIVLSFCLLLMSKYQGTAK
jgi:hypothetical protein